MTDPRADEGLARWTRLGPEPGSRCLVVGGCGGIGRAYVEGLAAGGARIAVVDLAASIALTPLPEGVETLAADVRDEAGLTGAVRSIGDAWDGLDVFAYVTGVNAKPAPVESMALDAVRDILEVNLIGAFVASRAAMPYLRRSAAGAIVFVSSGLSMNVEKGFGPYSASKGGLNALMKALAREGAPTIRANAVAPGLVDTAFLSGGTGHGGVAGEAGEFLAKLGEQGRQILASIPLGRVARPEDVAGPMLFLSGPSSGFVTGHILHVNGGRFTP
jgi:NAD(P)-dependent dehydrogenase (short-subunit alcohol dehydrogenase family)